MPTPGNISFIQILQSPPVSGLFYDMHIPRSRYYKHAGAKFYETAHPQGTAVMDQWGCADTPGGVHNKTPCNQGQPNPAATMQELRTICRPHDLYEKGCTRLNTTVSDWCVWPDAIFTSFNGRSFQPKSRKAPVCFVEQMVLKSAK